jgi:hypothetical protein
MRNLKRTCTGQSQHEDARLRNFSALQVIACMLKFVLVLDMPTELPTCTRIMPKGSYLSLLGTFTTSLSLLKQMTYVIAYSLFYTGTALFLERSSMAQPRALLQMAKTSTNIVYEIQLSDSYGACETVSSVLV